MNTLSPFLTLNCSCDEALKWSSQNFAQSGLNVIQTFDLHTARHALEDCPCPNHGTSECDCQMLVLLVYDNAVEPITLILHGNDGQTWLSISDANLSGNPATLSTFIKNILSGKQSIEILDSGK